MNKVMVAVKEWQYASNMFCKYNYYYASTTHLGNKPILRQNYEHGGVDCKENSWSKNKGDDARI